MNRAKLKWYANRLQNMSRQEVAHRLHEAVMQRTFKLRRVASSHSEAEMAVDVRRRIRELLSSPQLGSNRAAPVQDRILNDLRQKRVSVFGATWELSDGWDSDPATRQMWPSVAAHKINYRQSSGPDPKGAWEVNRLLYLCALATPGGGKPLEAGFDVIESWLDHDEPGIGIAWSSSIEVGLRALALTFISAGIQLREELQERVLESLEKHARWLASFPSLYSSANNHRVAELVAQLVLSSAWPHLTQAPRANIESELASVAETLFALDGIGEEQSPTYAAFSLEMIAISIRVARWEDSTARHRCEAVLSRGLDALVQFTTADGALMRYGDDDDGKVLGLLVDDGDYVALICELAGIVPIPRQYGLTTFAAGGHSVFRQRFDHLDLEVLFDHAPLGFGSIAAHGHADALHCSVFFGGSPLIADPGTYAYHGDTTLRNYFRSSAAHNAPVIRGEDSSLMTGDFNWSARERAVASLSSASATAERSFVVASHDGYRRRFGSDVARRVELSASGSVILTDSVTGATRDFSVRFTFPAAVTIDSVGEHVYLLRGYGMLFKLELSGASESEVTPAPTSSAWYSPRFGSRERAGTLTVTAAEGLQTTLTPIRREAS